MPEGVHRHHRADDPTGAAVDAVAAAHFSGGRQVVAQGVCIHAKRALLAVNKMRCCLAIGHSIGGSDEGKRWQQHFVTSLHTRQEQRYMQRCCAVDHGYRALRTGEGCQVILETVNELAYGRHEC